MKHLTEHIKEETYRSNIYDFYFRGMKTAILDIETTGLSPSRNRFILGGLYDMEEGTVHQFFAETRDEEKEAIYEFVELLREYDMVITYNGKHFDIPFIAKRYGLHFPGIKEESYMPYNLDLYLVLNGHSPIRKLVPNLKQKTVENYMGLWSDRTDEISGRESVELYDRYEATQDPALGEKILLHNRDDVVQLARLLPVIAKSDFNKAMNKLGFPESGLTVTSMNIHKEHLIVRGIQRGTGFTYTGFSMDDYPVESYFSERDMTFTLTLPLVHHMGMDIADLKAAGLDTEEFSIYPGSGSGFLVLQHGPDINYMEINHFVKSYIRRFMENI